MKPLTRGSLGTLGSVTGSTLVVLSHQLSARLWLASCVQVGQAQLSLRLCAAKPFSALAVPLFVHSPFYFPFYDKFAFFLKLL